MEPANQPTTLVPRKEKVFTPYQVFIIAIHCVYTVYGDTGFYGIVAT